MKQQKAGRSQDSFEAEPIEKMCSTKQKDLKLQQGNVSAMGQTDRPKNINRGKCKQANSSQQWEEDTLQ